LKTLFKAIAPLTAREIQEAKNLILQEAHDVHYPGEKTIQPLDLKFDKDGLLRARERIKESGVDYMIMTLFILSI
jgi:hypothetical protein